MLSVRRATHCLAARLAGWEFQSTLSVRRATEVTHFAKQVMDISIHALRKESDKALEASAEQMKVFQSTLSVRRATVQLDIFVHFLRRKPAAWL